MFLSFYLISTEYTSACLYVSVTLVDIHGVYQWLPLKPGTTFMIY
jgi:hypothetical protein